METQFLPTPTFIIRINIPIAFALDTKFRIVIRLGSLVQLFQMLSSFIKFS